MVAELAMLDSPEFAGGSGLAGNLVASIQRKKALVGGSVFVNREEWIRSPRCAPSLPSRKREASVRLRRSWIWCPRSSPARHAARADGGHDAVLFHRSTCFLGAVRGRTFICCRNVIKFSPRPKQICDHPNNEP